ncbi:ATP-dependent DNA helicase [Mycena indigotica]|uniref:ATP-dependent DNA helicase n=1 Tax=Mycena indigotica TaxID=2126181 RepID=A0A8H6VWW1_9AGAR|nr:ATP-dependent DNA helicase [Mycena indigotica]KAF7294856.1 ATP-dependent DNA helicase [Mycena indigotica]
MPGLFRVRRQRVLDALIWLKANNRLYDQVIISEQRLGELPVDDVPAEIMEAVRYSDDIDAVGREHAGYVPMEQEQEENEGYSDSDTEDSGVPPIQHAEEEEEDDSIDVESLIAQLDAEGNDVDEDPTDTTKHEADGDAQVFPLQIHGVVDVGGENIPDATLFAHAVENAIPANFAQDYGIRKGNAFVNEFARYDENKERFDGGPANPNHLLGAFPILFPYGYGGLEVDRKIKVTYEEHVRWALQHASGRFRRHTSFIFQVFGVLWKRQVCRSASLHIDHNAFIASHEDFMKIRPKDLLEASEEENHKVEISNPTIRLLRRHITTIRAKVPGTDENRVSIRSQIWGMTLKFNPPSIWTTINLSDSNDPIAQVLAGVDIDLDKFVAKTGPNATQRAQVIGADPYAAAEYFHLVVKIILEEMIGVKSGTQGAINRKMGVLGFVNGYIGTVEAQARGSLHLHILFWLKDAPTANDMQEALRSETFRDKIKAFIHQNIRADLTQDIQQPTNNKRRGNGKSSVAFSRPEDPRLPDYDIKREQAENHNAGIVQAHTCTVYYCLKGQSGKLVCKRGHPWATYTDDWVDEYGNWGPKRRYSFLNPWNPAIFAVTRSNMDIKLLTNSWETKDIAFYITLYIAKKQVQAANASALLANCNFFLAEPQSITVDNPIQKINKKLLQQCANTLSRQYELSGPEVISYLMGWGDRYISHTFVKVYWDTIVQALHNAYPHLVSNASDTKKTTPQYADRAEELSHLSVYEFFLTTYHDSRGGSTSQAEQEEEEEDESQETVKRGRPPSQRFPYLANSDRKGARVIRGPKQETALHIVGRWLPSRDDPNVENYSAQLLLLLKPWRALSTTLRKVFLLSMPHVKPSYRMPRMTSGAWSKTSNITTNACLVQNAEEHRITSCLRKTMNLRHPPPQIAITETARFTLLKQI